MILIIICIVSYDLTTSNIRNANSADSIGDTIATNSICNTDNIYRIISDCPAPLLNSIKRIKRIKRIRY